jgi:mRNA-degrading endonuclease RelE of RelBE toxin-antitoxin system
MAWILHFDKEAQRQLKKIAKSPQKPLFDKAFRELQYSSDPTLMGVFKAGLGCYAYEVNKPLRILYSVFPEKNDILIHDLGGHKQVYGKD